jgi:hypothetical protein
LFYFLSLLSTLEEERLLLFDVWVCVTACLGATVKLIILVFEISSMVPAWISCSRCSTNQIEGAVHPRKVNFALCAVP